MHTMSRLLTSAAAVVLLASPALAQDASSVSGSGAEANSGSISGSAANGNQQGQSQNNIGGNNAGIGNSESNSRSASDADSASISNSRAASDQHQSLDNRSTTSTNTSQAQMQGQTASQGNQQGVAVSNTFNSTPLKRTYNGTNTPVMLAASSSFSSDFCGSTVSGGASVAPIGVTIGASGPRYDESCRYLRLGEKAGMLAANYHNMQQEEMAMKAMSLMSWAVCMAGPHPGKEASESATAAACASLGLMGNATSAPTPPAPYVAPPPPQAPVTPLETQKPNDTQGDYLPYKTPRGENSPPAGVVSHSAPDMASATIR
jgi:hypothetical protein